MLTKSDVQSFLQCPRKLWLEHRRPDLLPPADSLTYRRAVDGQVVGERAREQLGAGFLWPAGATDKREAARNARDLLIANPGKAAAEVPMVNGELYARADALVPEGAGYILRETKSSSFPLKKDKLTPDKPEEHHLQDVAIQTWVMDGAGLPAPGWSSTTSIANGVTRVAEIIRPFSASSKLQPTRTYAWVRFPFGSTPPRKS